MKPETKRTLEAVLKKILSASDFSNFESLPESVCEISVAFCSKKEIAEYNLRTREKEGPTDVLSFPIYEEESPHPGELLGELLLCPEVAKEQCESFGNTFEQEILRLLVHGCLHLLGFDHEDVPDEERLRMEREEDRLESLLRQGIELSPLSSLGET